jgi:hypothetical protein
MHSAELAARGIVCLPDFNHLFKRFRARLSSSFRLRCDSQLVTFFDFVACVWRWRLRLRLRNLCASFRRFRSNISLACASTRTMASSTGSRRRCDEGGWGGGGARPTLTGTYIQVLSARATTASGVSFDAMNVKTMLMVRFFFFSSADCSLTHALTLVGLCFCFFGQGLLANVASIHEPVPRAATRR